MPKKALKRHLLKVAKIGVAKLNLKTSFMIERPHILFYLPNGKSNKLGLTPIYCRITISSERASFSINRSITPNKWDPVHQKVKGNTEEAKLLNSHLNLITNKVYETVFRLESTSTKVTPNLVKETLLGKEAKKSKDLFKVFEEHNNKLKALVNLEFAEGTHERYITTLKHIKSFVLHRYKCYEFKLKDVNHEFITEFDFYMRTVKKCSNNTTVKYIMNFRKIIKLALANAWLDKDPFVNYKKKIHKVDRGYLTAEELETISKKSLGIKRIEQVRDVFVFQCYTGLAYCDTYKLSKQNLFTDEKGINWLKTKRTKTETPVSVPLLSTAQIILDKYAAQANDNDQKLLPVLSNQKMNAYLKEIADLCGITKRLSCHLARHTFATTVTLANGISLESASKMLGHTNLLTTKIYARMLDSRVLDEMQILKGKLSSKTDP